MFRCQIMQLGFRATRFEHNLLPFQEFAYGEQNLAKYVPSI